MLLALEVGNSNTLFGLYEHGKAGLRTSFRLSTDRNRMPDEWFALLSSLLDSDGVDVGDIDSVILSSVVPHVTTMLSEMSVTRLKIEPVVVGSHLDLGVELLVDEPEKVGADRIVDCFAVQSRYGGPAIIIDLGTATTIDVIDEHGNYLGGSISAGVGTSLRALATNAAQLFSVELKQPDRVIGRNTAEQLQSGIVIGHQAMLEGMIERMRKEIGTDAPVILTGGLAKLFAGKSPLFNHYDPDLTIDGLRMIHDRVQRGRSR
jgi:type III pantothenate kinase